MEVYSVLRFISFNQLFISMYKKLTETQKMVGFIFLLGFFGGIYPEHRFNIALFGIFYTLIEIGVLKDHFSGLINKQNMEIQGLLKQIEELEAMNWKHLKKLEHESSYSKERVEFLIKEHFAKNNFK